jgi:hypothetical protein
VQHKTIIIKSTIKPRACQLIQTPNANGGPANSQPLSWTNKPILQLYKFTERILSGWSSSPTSCLDARLTLSWNETLCSHTRSSYIGVGRSSFSGGFMTAAFDCEDVARGPSTSGSLLLLWLWLWDSWIQDHQPTPFGSDYVVFLG